MVNTIESKKPIKSENNLEEITMRAFEIIDLLHDALSRGILSLARETNVYLK